MKPMPHIIEITDFEDPQLDIYARLTENQLLNCRDGGGGIFIAESPRVIARALDAGCVPISFLAEKKHVEGQAGELIARCGEIPVYTAEFQVLTRLTGFQLTRGMLCAMYRPLLPSVREVCAHAKRVAVLEAAENPTNVGAIFRSAAALNMDAVLLTPGCSNPLYRRAIRVSMGTVFQVPWTFLGGGEPEEEAWPKQGIRLLRELGFRTAAMALSQDALKMDDPRLKEEKRLAVVLGTEGDGLAPQTVAACDYVVRIPMAHGVDSLNVAAASAVAFWEITKEIEEM